MGCDIHIHVEYRKDIYIGGARSTAAKFERRWVCGDYFILNPNYDPDRPEDGEKEHQLVRFCDDRDYPLFATLANVRNYSNTAYISEPRGLPADVTTSVLADSQAWGVAVHTHSYLSLQELIDFKNKMIPLKHRGMISPEAQRRLDEYDILPDEWCQYTNKPGWAFREWEVENDTLDELINALKQRADELYLIPDRQWEKAPKRAYKMAADIRIVFWFDN